MKSNIIYLFAIVCLTISVVFWSHYPSRSTYIKPIPDPVITLDPSKTRLRSDYMIARAIFGQIVKLNEYGDVLPGLIKEWSVSEDGLRYSLTLRTDAYFHSGRLANIDDLVFSIEYLASPNSLISYLFSNIVGFNDYQSGIANKIKGVKKLSKNILEITLIKPSHVFLINLSDPKVVILPKNLDGLDKESFFKKPYGIGSYKLEYISPKKDKLILKKFDKFYDSEANRGTDEVHIIQMSKQDALDNFKKSRVHDLETYILNPDEEGSIKNISKIFSVSVYSTNLLFFNGQKFPFNEFANRSKINRVISISDVKKKCRADILKSTSFIPRGTIGWLSPKETPKDSSSQKHGSGKIPTFKVLTLLSYNEDIHFCELNEIINQIERKLRIKIIHKHVTFNEALKIFSNGDYDLFFETFSSRGVDPFHLLSYVDPISKHNITRFFDSNVTQFSEQIRAAEIRDIRASIYKKLSLYLVYEKKYLIPLFTDIRRFAFQKEVISKTVPATILMNTEFNEVWIE